MGTTLNELPDVGDVIQRGREARELRNSTAFMSTVNDLSTYFLAQIVSCPTADENLPALRHAHLMHSALGEIVSHLDARAMAGEQSERTQAERLEETLNEDDI